MIDIPKIKCPQRNRKHNISPKERENPCSLSSEYTIIYAFKARFGIKESFGGKKKVKFSLLQKGQAAQGCSLGVLSSGDGGMLSCIRAGAAPELSMSHGQSLVASGASQVEQLMPPDSTGSSKRKQRDPPRENKAAQRD